MDKTSDKFGKLDMDITSDLNLEEISSETDLISLIHSKISTPVYSDKIYFSSQSAMLGISKSQGRRGV